MQQIRTLAIALLAVVSHASPATAQSAAHASADAAQGTPHASASAQSASHAFRDEFMRHFRSSTIKLMELARAMPEEAYGWSPEEGVMPVGQVYAHIARYNYYYPQTAMGVPVPEGVDLETMEQVRDKEQVIALLERSVQHVNATIPQLPAAQLEQQTRLYGRDVPQWAVLFQLLAHMNEHLGQSIAYARSNGVVPPWSR